MTEKIDLLDKKIINALNKKVRASYSEIARQIHSSKEVVNYRIKRLQELGIIKEFVTIFGLGYWSYKVLIQFEKINNQEEKHIINYLSNNGNITWITSCSGNWDLVFVIMARDPIHFDTIFREIISRLGPFLQDYKMAVSTGSQTYGHTYLLGQVQESRPIPRKISGQIPLDQKDKAIANLLRKNARIKLTEIAAKTGLGIDTIKYRIKKMEQEYTIKRYRLILDTSSLGYNHYEIFLRCVNLTDQIIAKFREYAKQNHQIEYFSKCVGNWDIEFTAHFRSSKQFREFMMEIKELFGEQIKNFESITLFETYNHVYQPEELN